MAMKTPLSFQGSIIPFRTCGQCIRRPYHLGPARTAAPTRHLSTSNPLRSAVKNASGTNPLRSSGNVRSREQEVAQYRRSMGWSAAGIAVCAVAMYGMIKLDAFGLEEQQQEEEEGGKENNAMKMEGPQGFASSPSIVRIQGQDGVEQVATGTSSVSHFPATIRLPKYQAGSLKSGDEVATGEEEEQEGEEEYQLLGLGIRTVSFLKIQVYVVGLYVATSDISELQRRLVHTAVDPPSEKPVISNAVGATSATSLVSTERQHLKELLLDEEKGDAAWDAILKEDGLRTVFRIVPTRNTDFLHLRDGFVRGITARAQKATAKAKAAAEPGESGSLVSAGEFQDEAFGISLNDFKSLFGGSQRKNVPKGQTLLLIRNAHGELDALFQPEPTKPLRFMGRVSDERISRLVWMNYLAGKPVSSEEARRSVVDGIMAIVERPVGTLV
ncbi:hypothetical protein ARAM_005941 [Aspergillus rambellii]|uniref:Chalcone isomerase domain-containing protein n=1 Tax=Aspergillus rambellii TaxID=308745 RepID=A0A0F8VSG9_9EURO|nr:hypothetical protein ARAM_005941 [Aspergillus rambellii]